MPHVWTARDRQHTLKGETTLVLARTKPVPEGNPAWEQESNEKYRGDERAKGFSSFISGFHILLGYSCHPLCAVARKMRRFCQLAHRSLTANQGWYQDVDECSSLQNSLAAKGTFIFIHPQTNSCCNQMHAVHPPYIPSPPQLRWAGSR